MAAAVLSVSALGCGSVAGSDGGTGGGSGGQTGSSANSVTGSVNGKAFVAASAAAQRFTNFTAAREGLAIRLSEHSALCNASASVGYASTDKRLITLRIENNPGAGVVSTGQHKARLDVASPQCNLSVNGHNSTTVIDIAMDVAVTLTNLTGKVQGTFSGSLSSGAPISGTFDTEYCNFYDWEQSSIVKCGP